VFSNTPRAVAPGTLARRALLAKRNVLSGSHAELIPAVLRELEAAGAAVPVVVGGIIPPADEAALREAGVARVYTPKDFELSRIMGDIVAVGRRAPRRCRRSVTLVTHTSVSPLHAGRHGGGSTRSVDISDAS
jgi:ethylmalonyl-CoA mutase